MNDPDHSILVVISIGSHERGNDLADCLCKMPFQLNTVMACISDSTGVEKL